MEFISRDFYDGERERIKIPFVINKILDFHQDDEDSGVFIFDYDIMDEKSKFKYDASDLAYCVIRIVKEDNIDIKFGAIIILDKHKTETCDDIINAEYDIELSANEKIKLLAYCLSL